MLSEKHFWNWSLWEFLGTFRAIERRATKFNKPQNINATKCSYMKHFLLKSKIKLCIVYVTNYEMHFFQTYLFWQCWVEREREIQQYHYCKMILNLTFRRESALQYNTILVSKHWGKSHSAALMNCMYMSQTYMLHSFFPFVKIWYCSFRKDIMHQK